MSCKMVICKHIEQVAALLYTTYSEAVGGVAFNGDKLPTWEEFSADPAKKKQADAWRVVGTVVRDANMMAHLGVEADEQESAEASVTLVCRSCGTRVPEDNLREHLEGHAATSDMSYGDVRDCFAEAEEEAEG